jgi:cobalamin biosynthesis protein CbiD
MLIFARVTLNDSGEITLSGGEGVGTVTRKGLACPSAVRRLTARRVTPLSRRARDWPDARGDVEIFAPEGEARAQKTYNSRLGILGGISIIGTTGIVTPMSGELETLALWSWKLNARRGWSGWCWCRAITASVLSASRWALMKMSWSP